MDVVVAAVILTLAALSFVWVARHGLGEPARRARRRRPAGRRDRADPAPGGPHLLLAHCPAVGERVMVCVDGRPDSSELVRRTARLARRGGGPLYVLRRTGEVAQTVVEVAGELAVSQIVLGESIIARILRETDGVDVHIIADREGRSGGPQ